MNFFADESLDRQIVDRLRVDGHNVLYVIEMESGISDDIVMELSNETSSILITADKDFGELVFRQKRVNSGVILSRLAGSKPEEKAEIICNAVNKHGAELINAFTVITTKTIRIRQNVNR